MQDGSITICKLNPKGKFPEDWWNIPSLIGLSKERLGYPTQKPESLLERIIKTSSNPGDIVLDAFCGCGTTIAVAQKLNRQWIGIDVEPLSCTVMQHRLAEIVDLKKTLTEKEGVDLIVQSGKMNGFDFQGWIIDVINGTPNEKRTGDRGIDGWIDESLTGKNLKFGTLENGDPIQVKIADKVGGVTIRLFAHDMQDHSEHGVIIAYGFVNTADKEVEIARKKHGVEIELLTIRDILMLTDKSNVKAAAKLPKGQKHLGAWK
jgi:SAM-dependent methyltransferase